MEEQTLQEYKDAQDKKIDLMFSEMVKKCANIGELKTLAESAK